MTRDKVYELIDEERDYQDQLPPGRTDGRPKRVAEYLTMFRHYLRRAEEAWTMNGVDADHFTLEQVRKLAAIAVHCMEDHGAPPRKEART